MRCARGTLLLILLAVAVSGTLLAGIQPSPFINYQGVLRDNEDKVLTGDYDMQFLFYDAETVGNLLLTDSHIGSEAVGISGGLFETKLGGGTLTPGLYTGLPAVFANVTDVWLEVKVYNGDSESWETLSPRTRIVSAAFSLNTDHLDGEDSTYYLDTSATAQTKTGDLAIGGQVTIEGGSPAAGKVLTSDAVGLASWQDGVPGPVGPTGPEGPEGPQGLPGAIGRPLHTVTTVDSTDDSGFHSAVTIGADGLPVIAYVEGSTRSLKVAHCTDPNCATTTITDTGLRTGTNVEETISITMGPDGYPVITCADGLLVDCQDALCSSTQNNSIHGNGYTSVVIGRDGLPLVGFTDYGDVKLAYCDDAACSTIATVVTIDDSAPCTYTSLTLGPEGMPMIAYAYQNEDRYRFARCQDYDCTSIVPNVIFNDPTSTETAKQISLTTGYDGLPMMSMYYGDAAGLRFYRCDDVNCNSGSGLTLDSVGDVGRASSITVGSDGFPVIAYYDATPGNSDMKVMKCGSADCSIRFDEIVIDDMPSGDVGGTCSITIAPDGNPIITYYDDTEDDLKSVKCSNPRCVPYFTRR